MSNETASSAIKEMVRCTRKNRKIIIFDGVWPRVAIFRLFSWMVCRFDRGAFVRTEKELLELVKSSYPGNWQHIRFTYSFTGLEGLFIFGRPKK